MQERGSGPEVTNEADVVRRAWLVVAMVAAFVVVIDQVVKTWILQALEPGESIALVGDTRLVLVFNKGIAFGLGEGFAPVLVPFALVLFLVLLLAKRVDLNRWSLAGSGLVLGGAVGNLFDRLFRDTDGAVVDFVDLRFWPVFNVADAAIVVGATVLVLCASRKK